MSNKLRHDRASIEKRQKKLRAFLLDSNNERISKKQINSFYEINYPSLSSSTISRDLEKINAKCDKKNGNTYYLTDIRNIINIKNRINIYLKKCIIYKPMILSTSINVLEYDSNPSLDYYCITIKSKFLNNGEYYLENLMSNLKKLPDFYDNSSKFNYIEIKKSIYSIMFIFDNMDNMKNFYIFLNDLRSFNN